MDQDLKQRLVGAVVITSIAAIFLPMLFDDPIDDSEKLVSELSIPAIPVKFRNSGLDLLPKSVDEVINHPDSLALKTKLTSLSTTLEWSSWYVQMGNFSKESNAISLQNKIRQQGFRVEINSVTKENELLYRVWVGPELDEDKAKAAKLELEKLNNINGILISGIK